LFRRITKITRDERDDATTDRLSCRSLSELLVTYYARNIARFPHSFTFLAGHTGRPRAWFYPANKDAPKSKAHQATATSPAAAFDAGTTLD